MADPVLRIDGMSRRFGGLWALRDVSADVAEGEILGIIGPNGAGKSTLFNAIVGLVPPTRGRVELGGSDITALPVHRIVARGLAKTSQTVQVFGELSVLDNVAVGGLLHHRSRADAVRAAADELDFWELADLAGRPAADLPLAQRATLELARALVLRPRVLLVDEVMAGLGEAEVQTMLDRLRRLNAERAVTLVVIEHDMAALMRLCHRILALDQGEVIAHGEPEQVSRDPRVTEAYLGVEET